MAMDYIEARDGNLYVGKSRVTAATVITWWNGGEPPERIHEGFPTDSLAAIYGAIAYYLDHQEEMDAWMRASEATRARLQAESEAAQPE